MRSLPAGTSAQRLSPKKGASEGLITEKIPYEISKSWDFAKDFRISAKISRFQSRFQDFTKISRFHLRFQDFTEDFKISLKISRFHFKISRLHLKISRLHLKISKISLRILGFPERLCKTSRFQ